MTKEQVTYKGHKWIPQYKLKECCDCIHFTGARFCTVKREARPSASYCEDFCKKKTE